MNKIFLLFGCLLSTVIWSQNTNISPYSFFSIGDVNPQITVAASGMGGIAVTANRNYELNFSNPALLSGLQLTTFDISGRTQLATIKDTQLTQKTATTTVSYLTIGFPITKKMGLMLGVQPNTNVGYSINQEQYNSSGTLIEANKYYGTGGTNRLFIGTGYTVYDNLSIGLEGEVLFGTVNNTIDNSRYDVLLPNRYYADTQIKGSSLKIGAAYLYKLKNEKELTFESSIKLSHKLQTTTDDIFYNYYPTYSGQMVKDTLFYNESLEGTIKRPALIHTGVGYGKTDKWYVGMSFDTQQAWEFNQTPFVASNFKNVTASKIGVGGYYLPKKNSISSYWDRVIYRAGFRYEKTGISIENPQINNSYTDLKDFGISFGLGLPVGNQLSKFNLSVEYGKRGNTTAGLIQENYFNLRFGINLAEKWFQKNKIN